MYNIYKDAYYAFLLQQVHAHIKTQLFTFCTGLERTACKLLYVYVNLHDFMCVCWYLECVYTCNCVPL